MSAEELQILRATATLALDGTLVTSGKKFADKFDVSEQLSLNWLAGATQPSLTLKSPETGRPTQAPPNLNGQSRHYFL